MSKIKKICKKKTMKFLEIKFNFNSKKLKNLNLVQTLVKCNNKLRAFKLIKDNHKFLRFNQ